MKLLGRKSSVGRDAIYLTVSRIAVSVIGLITSMLLARFRTLEEYGTCLLYTSLRAVYQLRKICEEKNIEIIHAIDAYTALVAVIAFKKKKQKQMCIRDRIMIVKWMIMFILR